MELNPGLDGIDENGYHSLMGAKPPTTPPQPGTGSALPLAMGRVTSQEILGPKGELIIEHEGREYRLRLTQNRKLILTA